MTAPLCIVVKGFPRLSETFVTRELEALEDSGISFSLASLRRAGPDAKLVRHRVGATLNYLPEYLHEESARTMRAVFSVRTFAGFPRAWRMFRLDLSRDFSRNRWRRFGQACVLAVEMPETVRHLHAHFIHTPASVARYAAAIRGITYSVSAHAKDIWTSPDWDLRQKLDESVFVCVCNAAGAKHLAAHADPSKIKLWPHMVADLEASRPNPPHENAPVRLLTVARAVEKKGLRQLLDALEMLPATPRWTWTHIGGGPLLTELKARAIGHKYHDRITFRGAQPHDAVEQELAKHDVFLLAAIEADDGDRDGRPNALIEAMSASLACVAAPAGGIPELLSDGAGVLANAEPREFSAALERLIRDPRSIRAYGEAALLRFQALRVEGQSSFGRLTAALREASRQ